jgi:hypothetical protein
LARGLPCGQRGDAIVDGAAGALNGRVANQPAPPAGANLPVGGEVDGVPVDLGDQTGAARHAVPLARAPHEADRALHLVTELDELINGALADLSTGEYRRALTRLRERAGVSEIWPSLTVSTCPVLQPPVCQRQ